MQMDDINTYLAYREHLNNLVRMAMDPSPLPPVGSYDIYGYTQKYGRPDQSRGQHLTDEFKLPQHITFSNESIYSNPSQQGGTWKKEGDKWHFYASPYNVKMIGADNLINYFNNVERDSILHLPPLRY